MARLKGGAGFFRVDFAVLKNLSAQTLHWGLWLAFDPPHILILSAATILFSGRWRSLAWQSLHLEYLVAGLLLGLIVYWGSLCVVRGRLLWPDHYLHAAAQAIASSSPPPGRLCELGGRAVYEEAFWRGTVQVLLGNGWLAVMTAAVLFTLQHFYYCRINRRPMHPLVLLEFALFSLTVGTLYAVSSQLLLVAGVHWVRDVLIVSGCGRQLAKCRSRTPS